MKKTMLIAAMLAITVLMMAAAPAMANNNHHSLNDLDDDLFFTGFSPLVVVEDVDFEEVGDNNRKEGECRIEDMDRDGFITEVELECFV